MGYRQACAAVFIGLAVAAVAGCGGSSSSGPSGGGGGGGASTATVQGQIVRTQSARGESVVIVALRQVLGIGAAEAADALADVTVELRDKTTGDVVKTTKTNAGGNFTFFDVGPGVYTVTVEGFAVASPPEVTVGAGDTGIITGNVTGSTATLTATVVASNFDNPMKNDAQAGHAINIARAGHCDIVEVSDLRESGMGWGGIARQCGAHPGVIGLGRGNVSDTDLADARGHVNNKRGGGKGKGGKKA